MQRADPGGAWLVAIGIFKLIKALMLVVLGIGVLKLVHHDVAEILSHWVAAVHIDPDNRYFQKLLAKLWFVNDHRLKELGVGTFFYAGLYLTEGLGLAFRKTWAEYFTIVVTASFLPLEVHLLTRHFTVVRLGAMLVNIVIVCYLIAHRLRERETKATLPSKSS